MLTKIEYINVASPLFIIVSKLIYGCHFSSEFWVQRLALFNWSVGQVEILSWLVKDSG